MLHLPAKKKKNSGLISAYMCPGLFSIAVIKTITTAFLGEEHSFGFHILSHGPLKKVRAGTWRQKPGGGMLLMACSPWIAQLEFSYHPGPLVHSGTGLVSWSLP